MLHKLPARGSTQREWSARFTSVVIGALIAFLAISVMSHVEVWRGDAPLEALRIGKTLLVAVLLGVLWAKALRPRHWPLWLSLGLGLGVAWMRFVEAEGLL